MKLTVIAPHIWYPGPHQLSAPSMTPATNIQPAMVSRFLAVVPSGIAITHQ